MLKPIVGDNRETAETLHVGLVVLAKDLETSDQSLEVKQHVGSLWSVKTRRQQLSTGRRATKRLTVIRYSTKAIIGVLSYRIGYMKTLETRLGAHLLQSLVKSEAADDVVKLASCRAM